MVHISYIIDDVKTLRHCKKIQIIKSKIFVDAQKGVG